MSGIEEGALLATLLGTSEAAAPEVAGAFAGGQAAGTTAGLLGSGGTLGGGTLAGMAGKAAMNPMTQVGMGLLNPQQPPPMRGGAMPMGGGQQAPIPMPYGNPSGNSLNGPPPGMTLEEWLKRKQMMGGMQ